uniref:Serine/threonine-protein kinase CDG1 n=1 Tax=Rhizophora mucronata TaxID=61149 RepID=A0A2P2JDS6_RHIMU
MNKFKFLFDSCRYLAPEYAENGVVSVTTDIYAFGIDLLQLVSGRKAADTKGVDGQSLRQWAELVIDRLALLELIVRRPGESYITYQLCLMAKAAYLGVQRSPEMRPSIGEVLGFSLFSYSLIIEIPFGRNSRQLL